MFAKRFFLCTAAMLLLQTGAAHAFFCIQWTQGRCVYWAGKQATLKTFLGSPGVTLINGTLSWDQNAFNAANDWNTLAAIQFTVNGGTNFIDPCGGRNGQTHMCDNTGPNGDNPIFFASSFCGSAFGDIIELTNNCWNSANGQMFNAPVFVNANVQWNAYDGALRFANGRPMYDIRRVLLHELGHVLGLDHPDDHGQTVEAIMNSQVSGVDRLQVDDGSGARSIYANLPTSGGSSVGTSGCRLQATRGGNDLMPLGIACLIVAAGRYRARRQSHSR